MVIARMFDDPFAHFKRQVEPCEPKVTVLELFHDPQRMEIVIESPPVGVHQLVQLPLSRMAKRRMSDIVDQGERLDQFRIQRQSVRNCSRYLRNFQRVRQPVPEMIGKSRGEYLRLGFQAPESPRVNDSIAVPSILATVGMRLLRVAPSARTPPRAWPTVPKLDTFRWPNPPANASRSLQIRRPSFRAESAD